ncbi:MAG TPA: DCC1-like thiol-disulfide oxidoreductase family protein [Steroidobacteraceae bacterium]|nr:DCC1-like thiol-disulfide oxidoreductase family protein [Steroidobacteraceae bacterium]
MSAAQPPPPVLVYDGGCPVCSSYVRYVRIRRSAGQLLLVNARSGGPWVERVLQAGLNLDDGMVLFYGGRAYHGVDCVHMLALLSTGSGMFNRINALVFSRPQVARIAYPVMRAGRNLLLRILNRPKLQLS